MCHSVSYQWPLLNFYNYPIMPKTHAIDVAILALVNFCSKKNHSLQEKCGQKPCNSLFEIFKTVLKTSVSVLMMMNEIERIRTLNGFQNMKALLTCHVTNNYATYASLSVMKNPFLAFIPTPHREWNVLPDFISRYTLSTIIVNKIPIKREESTLQNQLSIHPLHHPASSQSFNFSKWFFVFIILDPTFVLYSRVDNQ